ncbi:hypothetical protein FA09DRAFT_166300 [Tilletiopsis washingtonensis]|jgi:hypothetical protein|uniref:Uncharacterized protein n=1 Tax=Tilletiopsis washingtonensis TaxID=58919 RepID=A0A316Z106_9BASI|nr:hypothetical protein FA09DRAFT_166300 [Tilletiopsis washingtonensis]PWN94734.1 hypothetical protein FA09DRAFT_166300 [Tilletiopsis washingtonensis]
MPYAAHTAAGRNRRRPLAQESALLSRRSRSASALLVELRRDQRRELCTACSGIDSSRSGSCDGLCPASSAARQRAWERCEISSRCDHLTPGTQPSAERIPQLYECDVDAGPCGREQRAPTPPGDERPFKSPCSAVRLDSRLASPPHQGSPFPIRATGTAYSHRRWEKVGLLPDVDQIIGRLRRLEEAAHRRRLLQATVLPYCAGLWKPKASISVSGHHS